MAFFRAYGPTAPFLLLRHSHRHTSSAPARGFPFLFFLCRLDRRARAPPFACSISRISRIPLSLDLPPFLVALDARRKRAPITFLPASRTDRPPSSFSRRTRTMRRKTLSSPTMNSVAPPLSDSTLSAEVVFSSLRSLLRFHRASASPAPISKAPRDHLETSEGTHFSAPTKDRDLPPFLFSLLHDDLDAAHSVFPSLFRTPAKKYASPLSSALRRGPLRRRKLRASNPSNRHEPGFFRARATGDERGPWTSFFPLT